MSSARESALRLLQLMMIASVVLPAALFAYASWVSYRDIYAVADERILRSLDVMQEQALKVFQTVDRTFAEVNEIVRGMSDEDIRVDQPRLHERLAISSRPCRNSTPSSSSAATVSRWRRVRPRLPTSINFNDRDYFQRQRRQAIRDLCERHALAAAAGHRRRLISIFHIGWNRLTALSTALFRSRFGRATSRIFMR